MTVMMEVTFPFGYVHATPWGTHVNEGAIEWPPSPWRLLRALAATWHARCPDLPADVVGPLFEALAAPPAVRAAPRTEASIRTYLPAEGHRSGAAKPDVDLAVDAFVAVAPGTGVAYRWDVDLSDSQSDALRQLADALPYLGRAESVCEARVLVDVPPDGWTDPGSDVEGQGMRVLVPDVPLDLSALCVSIRDMRKGGHLRPSGASWVRYALPPSVSSRRRDTRSPSRQVTAVRLTLSGLGAAAVRRPVPISVHQTLVVAEVARAAAMSQFGRQQGGAVSSTFGGKSADGTPLEGNQHAHWLPLDLNRDRLIDTVVVLAPSGFDEDELAALGSINRLRFHIGDGFGGAQSVGMAIEAMGRCEDLSLGRVLGPARRWTSATPFLPQRHRKREDIDAFLAECVRRELIARGVDAPFTIEREPRTSWGSFRRQRRFERLAQARSGFGFSLSFDEPMTGPAGGPLCIGSLAHFGMGRFEADS